MQCQHYMYVCDKENHTEYVYTCIYMYVCVSKDALCRNEGSGSLSCIHVKSVIEIRQIQAMMPEDNSFFP